MHHYYIILPDSVPSSCLDDVISLGCSNSLECDPSPSLHKGYAKLLSWLVEHDTDTCSTGSTSSTTTMDIGVHVLVMGGDRGGA